jgi:membrane protease YdiL (CAAX protease family)
MAGSGEEKLRRVPAVALIHQEGLIAVIAVVGLSLRDQGLGQSLAARGSLATAVFYGLGIGAACFGAMWTIRAAAPLKDLETWQKYMVGEWTWADAVAVAVFSGIAEEALMRALLQPIIGLFPAAAVFAVLHLVPDRKLWAWPLMALALGVVLGLVFERWGFPAAASAHVVINGLSLLRFRATRQA